jgi:hypothetical protein
MEKIYPDLAPDSAGPESQDKIYPELGVRLVHPSYRSGLQSILDYWLEYTISSKM